MKSLFTASLMLFTSVYAQAKDAQIDLRMNDGTTCYYKFKSDANGYSTSTFNDLFSSRVSVWVQKNVDNKDCPAFSFIEIKVDESIWNIKDSDLAEETAELLRTYEDSKLKISEDQLRWGPLVERKTSFYKGLSQKGPYKVETTHRIDRIYVDLHEIKTQIFRR